jgi:hypothetical protein
MGAIEHDTSLAMRGYLLSKSFRWMFRQSVIVLTGIIIIFCALGLYESVISKIGFGIFWFPYMILVACVYSLFLYFRARKKYTEHRQFLIQFPTAVVVSR